VLERARRLQVLAAVGAVAVLAAAPALARDIWKNDQDAANHTLIGLPAPGGVGNAALRLQDAAVCAGITKWSGVNGTSSCATDGSDFLSPSTGVLLGGHGPLSVFGRNVNTTGAGADIPATTDLTFLGRSSSVLSFLPLTASMLADGVATWAAAGARVFCIDGTSGSDANLGYADSADQTQANISTATATCGAVAKQTIAGMCAALPEYMNGRTAFVVINAGTYAETIRCISKARDGTINVRATGTNSTAGATKFTGTTADILYEGAQTCAGMNAAGYNPSTSATSASIPLVKVGGGSPGFTAEPAKPLYCRVRFDSATATVANRGFIAPIVKITGSDTIVLDSSGAFSSSDLLYLEEPGVLITATSPNLSFRAGLSLTLNGVQLSSSPNLTGSTVTYAFTHGVSTTASNGAAISTSTSSVFSPFPIIGPSRFSGNISALQGSFSAGRSSVLGVGTVTFTSPPTLSVLDSNIFGGNVVVTGSNYSATIGGTNGASSPLRIFGTLTLTGAAAQLLYIDFPSTTAAYGIVMNPQSNIVVTGILSGAAKTDAGISFANAYQSRARFSTNLAPTVTGTNGDSFWGASNTSNVPQGAYFSWAGLYFDIGQRSTNYMFPNGTILSAGPVDSTTAGQMHSGQPRMLTAVQNYGTGVTWAPGTILHFVFTDGIGATLADASSLGGLAGTLGVAADYTANLKSSFAVVGAQQSFATHEAGDAGCNALTNGGSYAYVSATTPGTWTCTKPALARSLGWTVGESTLQLTPDNNLLPVSRIYSNGTAKNVEQGLNFPSTFTVTDNTGAGRLDITVPAWLVDPGSNGMLARTSSTTTAARTLTAGGGGSITITNGDGVSGNPTISRAALSGGDVTAPVDSNVLTVVSHAVSNTKFRQSGANTLVGNPTGSTADVTDITLGAGCSFSGGALSCSGSGVPSSRTLTPDIGILIDGATSAVDLSANRTIGARYDNASITANGGGALQRAAISGDLSCAAGSNTCALTNIPSGTPMAGSLLATAIAAPSTPAAGKGSIYFNSTSKNIEAKGDAGVVNHGVQTRAATAHLFLTAISDAGSVSAAAPDAADLTGFTASRIPFANGTGLTDSANLQYNGQALGFGSLQEVQVFNASTNATALAGFRAGTDASYTNSFGFGMTGTSWSGGALAPNVGLVELGAGAAPIIVSNFGTGKISFTTTSSRTERVAIATNGNVTVSNLSSGVVGVTAGVLRMATAGTDFQGVTTFSTGLTNLSNVVTVNLSTGVVGGQSVVGGTAASNSLILSSTGNATKGNVVIGSTNTFFNETDASLIVNNGSQDAKLSVNAGAAVGAIHFANGTADSGGYLISTSADQGILAGGANFNGSNWIAKAPSASIFSMASGNMYFNANTGLTPGNAFSPTTVMNLDAATLNVAIGKTTTAGAYRLDVSKAGGPAQVHFSALTTDVGGYLTSTADHQAIMSGGMAYDGVNWKAKATSASSLIADSGTVFFYANTGLTPGSSFSPSTRMTIGPSGVNVASLGTALTKAVGGTLANASASDIAAAQDWPASPQFLFSTGLHSAPTGDPGFAWDNGDSALSMNGGVSLALYNLGSAEGDTNYERLALFRSANVFTIQSQKKGSGTVRPININAFPAQLTLSGSNVAVSTLTGAGNKVVMADASGNLTATASATSATIVFDYAGPMISTTDSEIPAGTTYIDPGVGGHRYLLGGARYSCEVDLVGQINSFTGGGTWSLQFLKNGVGMLTFGPFASGDVVGPTTTSVTVSGAAGDFYSLNWIKSGTVNTTGGATLHFNATLMCQ
jgi:hypothetical protein